MTLEQKSAKTDDHPLMTQQLKIHLWRRIDRRLQRGDILITNDQFQEAMEMEFRKLLHVRPNDTVKALMREMIAMVNDTYPGTYLSLGIKNAVTRFFRDVQSRTGQDAQAQEEAVEMIRKMVEDGRTAFFLESIGVEVGDRGVPPKVQDAIERILITDMYAVSDPKEGRRKVSYFLRRRLLTQPEDNQAGVKVYRA